MNQIELNAALKATGKKDKYARQKARPLTEHIADWLAVLEGRGTTKRYIDLVNRRARAVCTACRFAVWEDINPAAVWAFIGELRTRGLRTGTQNGYLEAIHRLTLWMRNERRVPDAPLVGVRLQKVTDETEVGVFTPAELRTSLTVTEQSPKRHGMPGGLRRLLYRFAVETGFRSSECRSMTWGDIDLDSATPAATVTARRAKNRQRYDQPLTAGLVRLLRAWQAECGDTTLSARVFPVMPDARYTARMLWTDMVEAGIPAEGTAGRPRHFHSLRHTFASNLAAAGVHPRRAMELMRHSDINLTMKRYTHTLLPDRAAALETLPDLDAPNEAPGEASAEAG